MADLVEIKEDEVLEARDYMPIWMKEQLSRGLAIFCTEDYPSVYDKDIHPIPPVARERRWLRAQVCMGVLAEWYLQRQITHEVAEISVDGKQQEQEMAFTMSQEEFDAWSASHVINQLERLKASKKEGVRNKVFDILYDFKAFENMFYGAIRDELENKNDICGRLNAAMSMQMSEKTLDELAKQAAAATAELAKRGREQNGR